MLQKLKYGTKLVLSLLMSLMLLLALSGAGLAQEEGAAPQRGLWVPRWGLEDPAWVARMVDEAAGAGFTALFVQVDGRGEAYYRSELLPPVPGLGDFDPLAWILELAHARGLKVHVWMNAFTVGVPGNKVPAGHVLLTHPDWITHDAAGQSLLTWPLDKARRELPGYFLDPALPEVKAFVVDVIREVATRYPIDGVHLDYIRYSGPEVGFHPAARAAFAAEYGADPASLAADAPLRPAWEEWRQSQVTAVVKAAAAAARAARPGLVVSAAVFPDLGEARRLRSQDWPRWLADGDLDFVAPMAYTARTSEMERYLGVEWAGLPAERIYPGLGAYKFGTDAAGFLSQLQLVQGRVPAGLLVYSYQSLQEMSGVFPLLRAAFAAH